MLYFAEVVERGGFAAAGRALGIPKSRLSRRVSDLEAHLGVRLLQRTTRKLSLTEVGEAYLRHCQAMRESAQAAADTVAQVQTTPRGTIRVSCPVTLAQTVLAELMPQFLARANWCGCCPTGPPRPPSCTRCFRRGAACRRRCGGFWTIWARSCRGAAA